MPIISNEEAHELNKEYVKRLQALKKRKVKKPKKRSKKIRKPKKMNKKPKKKSKKVKKVKKASGRKKKFRMRRSRSRSRSPPRSRLIRKSTVPRNQLTPEQKAAIFKAQIENTFVIDKSKNPKAFDKYRNIILNRYSSSTWCGTADQKIGKDYLSDEFDRNNILIIGYSVSLSKDKKTTKIHDPVAFVLGDIVKRGAITVSTERDRHRTKQEIFSFYVSAVCSREVKKEHSPYVMRTSAVYTLMNKVLVDFVKSEAKLHKRPTIDYHIQTRSMAAAAAQVKNSPTNAFIHLHSLGFPFPYYLKSGFVPGMEGHVMPLSSEDKFEKFRKKHHGKHYGAGDYEEYIKKQYLITLANTLYHNYNNSQSKEEADEKVKSILNHQRSLFTGKTVSRTQAGINAVLKTLKLGATESQCVSAARKICKIIDCQGITEEFGHPMHKPLR